MKLRNVTIRTQLAAGLGIILALVIVIGAMAWLQSESLWRETEGMYQHPLTVRSALSTIRTAVAATRQGMSDALFSKGEEGFQEIAASIAANQAVAEAQIPILRDRYLGPLSDVDEAADALARWKSVRDETIRLFRAGNSEEAQNRQRSTGIAGKSATALLLSLDKLDKFAAARAGRFYRDAQVHKNTLLHRLGVVLLAIVLLTSTIGLLLLNGIQTPLKQLTSATERFQQGDLSSRVHYLAGNEFGTLSEAFNSMAKTVQAELENNAATIHFEEVLRGQDEAHKLCRDLLNSLLKYTGSQIGAIYLLNERKTEFEHFESIGLKPAGRAAFPAASGEGEFGAALASRRIQHIANIPPDTRFIFSGVIGEFTPREIITVPVLAGPDVVAIISLANIRSYSAAEIRIVNDTWGLMSARLSNAMSLQEIRLSAGKLERQNRELEAQQRELAVQADELSEQNVELELQKKQLQEASRLKSNFLSNMSHELRTPLNAVIALSGVLSRRLAATTAKEEQEYIEIIKRNGMLLLGLINDILDLSRIEAGREEINLSHFSAAELVQEIVEMLQPQAREKGIALLNHAGGGLPPIRSDFAKCRHILQNLVSNAVKFTDEGSVDVSAAVSDRELRIQVSDTGIGIAAHDLENIFDKFHQADGSLTRKYGGTGLGLAIARNYVTMLQGSLTVESTPGKGSIFTLRLPLTLDAPETIPLREDDAGYSGKTVPDQQFKPVEHSQRKRILVVEDSEAAAIQLTDVLAGEGYQVLVASDGSEALKLIETTVPDAMILDLMMPEVDGFQVLRTIRGSERTARIPVLILTAKYVTPEELSFLEGNHIHQLIQKGDINEKRLLAAIERMVSPEPQDAPAPAPSRHLARPGAKPVVLAVEDNPDNMTTIRALLQDTCILLEAADGHSGVELARTHVPDIILMDLALPVMNGFEALEAIRNDERIKHIPVIAVTASAMSGNREEVLARGFNAYISKPIDEALLKQAIKEKVIGHQMPDDISGR